MELHESVGRQLRAGFDRVVGTDLPPAFEALLARLEVTASPAICAAADCEFKRRLTDVAPDLRRFARNLCRDEHLADDLVQDTMLKAWGARERFVSDTSIKAWTFTILRNAFLSQMRRKRFAGEWDERVAELALSAKADQDRRLHVEDVARAVAALPHAQREALMLVGAEELTYEDAAEAQGVPLGTIKSRVTRGRTALARLIDGENDEEIAA